MFRVFIFRVVALVAALCCFLPVRGDEKLPDYSDELPRIPGKSPAEAMAAFRVVPPFQIQAVATEPLVTDPVAMAFDADGHLYVVEMQDYSEHGKDFLGLIHRLTDTDDDGIYDKSIVFADHLSWPTAIICWDGGVFVGAPPEFYYMKDTDGDGVSDLRKLIFTGFSRSNVQAMMNSLRWGLDNRIHGAGSTTGGVIVPGDDPDAKPINLGRHDFSFDPKTLDFKITTASAQHGMSFDNWGHKFVCSNSNHIQQVMFEDWLVARNPYLKAPGGAVGIAADGAQAPVFRTSRVEPWRIVRTRLRVAGKVPGPVEKGGKVSGYFSSATGVTIYRGDAWAEEWLGCAIIGDVGSNLIHRKKLETDTIPFIARRVDKGVEFVTADDTWFRPVQFKNGPYGGLLVADFYRETIEHPKSLPPAIKMHLDLDSGNKMGRIYRIIPKDFNPRPSPHLSEATTAKLVDLLDHPNGWHRVTASKLIYGRQDPAAVPLLKELAVARSQKSPRNAALGRMHALYALAGLDALDDELLITALSDPHFRVRENAVRLATRRAGESQAIAKALLGLAEDESIWVRYRTAFALGEVAMSDSMPEELVKQSVTALGELLLDGANNRWMHIAALSSLTGHEATVLANHPFTKSSAWSKLAAIVARRGRPAELAKVADRIAAEPDSELAKVILNAWFADPSAGVRKVLAAAGRERLREIVAARMESAAERATDSEAKLSSRLAALEILRMAPYETAEDIFGDLASGRQPAALQKAAINLLRQYDDPDVADELIDAWPRLSPSVRDLAAEALTATTPNVRKLLTAIESGDFSASAIPEKRRQLLREHADPKIRKRAQKALAATELGERTSVVEKYRGVLGMTGEAARGRKLYLEHCSVCHKIGNQGHAVGPNLAAIKTRGAEFILLNVLDPSREVNPEYLDYAVVTNDGRVKTGMIDSESPTAVTLKRAENVTETILRLNIAEMRSTGRSLMPDGFEKELDQQAMADLIAYLLTLQ